MGPAYFWNALGMNYQQAKYDACYIFFHVIVSSGGLVRGLIFMPLQHFIGR